MKAINSLIPFVAGFLFAMPCEGVTPNNNMTTWKKWAQNPPTIPISVSIPTLYAKSNSVVQVTLADGITIGYGHTNGCSAATNAPTLFANVNVRREYVLTVVATNLQQLEMDLSVNPPWQLLSRAGSDSVPKDYTILIDRSMVDTIAVSTNCAYFSNSWIIEVRDRQGATWIVDDRSNDPKPAPGDGDFLQIGPAKSLLTNRISIDWSVGLGRLYDGLAAGRLRLSESGLSREAYTPKAIFYAAGSTNVRSQVDLINANADGSLRQVKAFQCFVDIIDPWTFSSSDITNLPSLASRLKTETNGVSFYISNNLATATQQALTNYLGAGSPAEPLQSRLVHDFNTILGGPSIYESNRFYGVSLSTETQFLLTQNAQGADLLRLNRLLFQDAFTAQLAKRPYQTALNFYLPTQVGAQTNQDGVYTNISGSGFVSWTIQNPQPVATTNLLLIESRNGVNRTNSLAFTPQSGTDNWILACGTGAVQRVEARGIGFVIGAATNRFETNTVHYVGTTNVYKCIENYQLLGWGWELVQTRIDPDGANLVTSFEFYSDANDDLTYGKPSVFHYPDGDWEVRLYNHDFFPGYIEYILRPFNGLPEDPAQANVSNCEAQTFDLSYGAGGHWTYVAHYVNDRNTGKLFTELIGGNNTGGPIEQDWEGRDHGSLWGTGGAFVGKQVLRGPDAMGKGLAGHEFYSNDAQSASRTMYYQGGTFDQVTRTFTPNGSDVAQGPDWRQCTLFWNGWYYAPDVNSLYNFTAIEGQGLYDPYGNNSVYLLTGVATRDATVFQSGSAVQKELSVFTGVDGGGAAVFDSYQRYAYKNDSLGHSTNMALIDVSNPTVIRTIYEASYLDANGKDGELLRWEADQAGVRTEYSYDALKKVTQVRRVGITNSLATVPDLFKNTSYDAQGRMVLQTSTGGGLTITNRRSYDLAGRVLTETSDAGLTTSYTYSMDHGQVVTITQPSGATIVQAQYIDRRLKSQTGTGVVSEFHDFSVDPNANPSLSLLDTTHWGAANSARWTAKGNNVLGLPSLTRKPDFESGNVVEEATGYTFWLHQPSSVSTTGKRTTSYLIDFDGQVSQTSVGYGVDLDSYDRTTATVRRYLKTGGQWFYTQTNLTYLTDGSAQATVTGVQWTRTSGFASTNIISEVTTWDADSNATVVITYVDRSAKKLTTVTDSAQSTLNATNIMVDNLLVSESTASVAAPTLHFYDGLSREVKIQTPLGFNSSKIFNQFGQVTNVTDLNGSSTSYEYYPNGVLGAGQLKCETRANGKKTYRSYTTRGEPSRTWGDVPYPEERIYSQYGELVELHTFRGGSGWGGATWPTGNSYDTTTWTYQEHSGFLTNKTDAAGRSVGYTYEFGRLATRTWARGVTTTYLYNDFGDLSHLIYSDDTPEVYFNNYNRAGQPREVVDGNGTSELTFDHANRSIKTVYTFGPLAGITVTNHFNAVYGRDALAALGLNSALKHDYGYDSYGRLRTVASGVYSATYDYKPNSDLLSVTTCKNNTTPVLATTRTWEFGSRLQDIVNIVNQATVISSHSYLYDSLNRRRQDTLEDGSRWEYDYNDRDELTGARHYWGDWVPMAGQQFGYWFDNIGNRTSATQGGDARGSNLRTTSYTANNLNEYTSITTPDKMDVLGTAYATAAVTVNNSASYRKGEYYQCAIAANNSSGPSWLPVTNCASQSSSTNTVTGNVLVPPVNQALYYDKDGNLTNDSVWIYTWDAENRLIQISNVTSVTSAARKKLVFSYDSSGRRVSKKVYDWSMNDYSTSPSLDAKFIYDGWNLIAVVNSQLSLVQSFIWGQDLSGTVDEAGGIGGLLMLTIYGGSNTNCFVGYDGNGNVTTLADATAGTVQGHYEVLALWGTDQGYWTCGKDESLPIFHQVLR